MNGQKRYLKDMDSPSKTSRKVRFTLPEHENNFLSFVKSRNSPAVQVKKQPAASTDDTKVHGTSRYINGTLLFVQEDFKAVVEENRPKIENKIVEPKPLRPCIKPPRKSREVQRATIDTETNSTTKSLPLPSTLSKKFHYFIRSRSESRCRKKEISERNRKHSAANSYAAFYFPDNIKTYSVPLRPPSRQPILLQKTPDILTVPTLSTHISLVDTMPKQIPANEQIVSLPNLLTMNLMDNSTDCESIPIKIQQLPHMNQMVNNDENFENFSQFFDRWQLLQNATNRKLSTIQTNVFQMNGDTKKSLIQKKKMPDGKSFSLLSSNYRKRIMNIEKTPLVTSLIRACKKADRDELSQVIRSIKENGITANDLNSVDKNGRTAISYICITSLTSVLDFLLRLQGIDVNKPDKEGNTPLHFAAESGQSEIIKMLITRSRSLAIDAKNVFGMTPLMKAAIQGRTDCAKQLLLANASPFERDPARGFTAKQWAHFCGSKFCADALGELIKNRRVLMTKEKINGRYPSDPRAVGITTKLRNMIPFYRPKLVSESDIPAINNSLILEESHKMNVVPNIEVTPANNHQLINKYKQFNAAVKSDKSAALIEEALPKVPLRRRSVNQ